MLNHVERFDAEVVSDHIHTAELQQRPFKLIGDGNTTVEEALYLANIASKVTVVHRRDQFRSEKILVDRLSEKEKNGNVNIEWNHVLDEVLGDDSGVTGIRIKDVQSDKTKDIDLKGVFITIGHQPNTQIFEDQLDINNGYLTIKSGTEGQATMTSIPGVFAVGDHVNCQAITSAGSGCMAAIDAETWMDNQ